jgi:hypothetical protein
MEDSRFSAWCDAATARMRYRPDRARVRAELMAHMEDRRDALAAAGMPLREAEAETVRAMGDADEVAAQLAWIHRPFWGYVLTATKVLLVLSLLAAALALPGFRNRLSIVRDLPDNALYARCYDAAGADADHRCTRDLRPGVSASSDGWTFTVTRALEWYYSDTDGDAHDLSGYLFYFIVEATNPRPWAVHTDILREFSAVDSLGNRYAAFWEQGFTDEPAVRGNPCRTGCLTTSHLMWLDNYVSQDADWIELRYDRAGRDIRLRIDLTGGETA